MSLESLFNVHLLVIDWIKMNMLNFSFDRNVTLVDFTMFNLLVALIHAFLIILSNALNSSTFAFLMVIYELFLAF
jgi:hypothetical protein